MQQQTSAMDDASQVASAAPAERKLLRRQNLAAMLVDDLRKRILSGEFTNNRLLRQEQLAREYGVSRMPVREALRQLDSEGLVSVEINKGATVSELSVAEIEEIFDLRIALEVDLLRRAIPNMRSIDFEEAQAVLEKLDQAYASRDIAKWGALNGAFHMSLYRPSNRSISLSLVSRLSLQVDRYLRLHISRVGTMEDGAIEHHTILTLCRKKRVTEALDMLTTHIRRTQEQIIEILSGSNVRKVVPERRIPLDT